MYLEQVMVPTIQTFARLPGERVIHCQSYVCRGLQFLGGVAVQSVPGYEVGAALIEHCHYPFEHSGPHSFEGV